MWWLCFAERRSRLVLLALTIVGLAIIALAGQPANAEVVLPTPYLTLSLVRSYFLTALLMGMCHGMELAVARFDNRWRKSFEEKNSLVLRLANQTRDLKREAEAHKTTLVHLSRSEGRYRTLFDNAFEGIVITNTELSRAIQVNSRMAARMGYTEAELLDRPFLSFSPDQQRDGRDREVATADIIRRLKEDNDVAYDWTVQTKHGELIDYEVYSHALPTEPDIRVCVFREVTQQRIAQVALQRGNRELRNFAHAASHDLKEPLRTMSNFAKLLSRRYADVVDDAGREYISYITDAAQRGTNLVQDLLRYAEVGTDTVETRAVNLNLVAATVQQNIIARLEDADAELSIEALPTVTCTPTWAQQLLQNLLSNALKFSRPGVKPCVRVTARQVGAYDEISVCDNGIGIPQENLEQVFGVFQRLVRREDYEGNGVGLALCQRIMDNLGGEITVASVYGEGTTFTLRFPRGSAEKLSEAAVFSAA